MTTIDWLTLETILGFFNLMRYACSILVAIFLSTMLDAISDKVRSGIQGVITEVQADFPGFIRNKLCVIGKYILKTIINFCISTALTLFSAFVCWLIYFRPFNLHPRVHSAALLTFDLVAPAPTPAAGDELLLLYDLRLNLSFLNKGGWSTVHFDHLTAELYYNGIKVGPSDDTLPSFKLKQEGGRVVPSVLRGRASAAVAEAFQRERAQGKFNLNVRVKTTLSYWFFPHKGTYYYQYDCWLKFPPVPGNATPAFAGGGFQCGVTK